MYVVFIHGQAASGKHTIGTHLAALTGLPLFHNHLAVDVAKSLFEFGTPAFNRTRATLWRTVFTEAAAVGRSFIFTFHPEASVEPELIDELVQAVGEKDGKVLFVELTCSRDTILQRIGNDSRTKFGKITDPAFYLAIEEQGAFEFPPLPEPIIVIDTGTFTPEEAARKIMRALPSAEREAVPGAG